MCALGAEVGGSYTLEKDLLVVDTSLQMSDEPSLCHNQLNKSQMNKRRNGGGFYHSYDPNSVKDGIIFMSKCGIELKMGQKKTAEVDSKGHMINNTH